MAHILSCVRYAYAVLAAVLLTFCTSHQISHEEMCEKIWRYDLECALNHTLSFEEISKVRHLALQLKGKNCVETAWRILEWIDENISYDYEKALLPPPVIEYRGSDVRVVSGGERMYQTPLETIMRKKGICGDYAILTAALLLASNCTAYIFNISFAGDDENHVTAAVKFDTYYVLDQHLPPLDLGSYYRKWIKDGKQIDEAVVYSVREGARKIEIIRGQEMVKYDYTVSESDVRTLENMLRKKFELMLKYDGNLNSKRLPPGYTLGKIWTLKAEDYAEYYTPLFAEYIADHLYKMLMTDAVKKFASEARAFSLRVAVEGDDIIVHLTIAR